MTTFGIYVATSGAVARQNQIDVVANNLANATTAGHRSVEVTFEEVLRDLRGGDRHMVATSTQRLSTEAGPIQFTDRPLDFAFDGAGFVKAEGRAGRSVLVRTGSLYVDNKDGTLRDAAGNAMINADDDKLIRLRPGLEAELTETGEVWQDGARVAQLTVLDVPDPAELEPLGNGTYAPTEDSGEVFKVEGNLKGGYLEGSNVVPVENMVEMIRLERGYQSTMKVIQAYREADDKLIQTSGR